MKSGKKDVAKGDSFRYFLINPDTFNLVVNKKLVKINTPSTVAPTLRRSVSGGFTLIELLIVIAIIGILAAMLLPVLGKAKDRANAVASMNNVRQLSIGWLGYPADNQDALIPNPGWVDTGSGLGWDPAPGGAWYFDKTGFVDPARSLMADYIKSADVYHCPADRYIKQGYPSVRNRSYSLSSSLSSAGGGGAVKGNGYNGDRKYFGTGTLGTGSPAKRTSDLTFPGPSMIYVMMDEHVDSINDGVFSFDPGYNDLNEQWRDLPGAIHRGSATVSFADGHAEIHKWVQTGDPTLVGTSTIYPVLMKSYGNDNTGPAPWKVNKQKTADYEWVEDRSPYQLK